MGAIEVQGSPLLHRLTTAEEDSLLTLNVDWVWETDPHHRVCLVHTFDDRPLSQDPATTIGRTAWEIGALNMTPADWAAHRQQLDQHLPFKRLTLQTAHPDGQPRWIVVSGQPRFDQDGHFLGYRGIGVDITEQKTATIELAQSKERLQATLAALPDLMFEVDRQGRYLAVHTPHPDWLLKPVHEVVGQYAQDLLPPDVWTICQAAIDTAHTHGHAGGTQYTLNIQGERRWYELSVARKGTPDDPNLSFVALVRDITAQKNLLLELESLAYHDQLTGLPNRRLLYDRIEQAALYAHRSKDSAALLFMDLDGFKQVNDAHGHDHGDELLRQLAQRLSHCVRNSDSVGRLSGDEFVVLLTQLSGSAEDMEHTVLQIAEKILHAVRQPFHHKQASMTVTASLGAYLFRGGERQAQDLINITDQLMYRAKASGKDRLQMELSLFD
jgi:diguanylate cyclase (GGDEF)-like protein/PAS domain S-box-containing protein